MERRKYIGSCAHHSRFKRWTVRTIRVEEEGLRGYAALWHIGEVNAPFYAGDTCLYDDGYTELIYLPDGAHWGLSAIYDAQGGIVEWYVDINRQNAVDEAGEPYGDDLYLDAVLLPDGRLAILDEDELQNALDTGKITQADYTLAYRSLEALQKQGILRVAAMETLCGRLLPLFGG